MRHSLLLLTVLIAGFSLNAQITNVDEQLRQLKSKPNNIGKVNQMIELARQIQYSNPAKMNLLVQDILKVSEAIHYNIGIAAHYGFKAAQYVNQMQLDSAKISNDKALGVIKEDHTIAAKNQLATLYNTYGVIYQQKQLYDSAAAMYLKVVKLCDETGNRNRKTFAYCNLSILYSFINDTIKTDKYARLALVEAKQTRDTLLMLRSRLTILNYFAQYNRYDSIPVYAIPALKMATAKNDIRSKAKLLHLIGDYQSQNEKLRDHANVSFQQALQLYRQLKSPYDEAIVMHGIGNNYLAQNKYANAIENFEQAINIEDEQGLIQLKTETLKSLSTAEAKNGNANRAYQLLTEYVSLNDSLAKKTNEEIVQTLETRYQLQKKEDTILLQQASIKQKNILNTILAGSGAALFIISLLSYRNYNNKRKLQQQMISELETEKQLTATEAVLKGEEQERTRLAKDLHDGLGGMLSGLKHSFANMKGNLIMTSADSLAFNRSMDMLDSSIKEMRRVAHNMMPEALVKFGLDTALKDFCMDINLSGALKVNYQSIGMQDVSLGDTTAITLFRIVQELLNNTMKHAVATHVIVQLAKTEQTITVTVEDDGKGFNPDLLTDTHGIGWANIKNRVDFLKGKVDVKSEPDQGTSVLIEFKV